MFHSPFFVMLDTVDDGDGGDSWRRIFSKSNGAVIARAPNPAAAPATTLCHCGYVFVESSATFSFEFDIDITNS